MSVTERNGCIGVVKGKPEAEIFHARGNFTLKVVAKVEGAKDGYVARVTRYPDNVTRYNTLSSTANCMVALATCIRNSI